MRRIVQADELNVQRFIHQRLLDHSRFTTLIAVSVQKHAGEFLATVWVGQRLDAAMRRDVAQLEEELREQGVFCSIVLKDDKDLPFGGKYPLRTAKGEFVYRYYRTDILGDEDFVYVFSLTQNAKTYRFRISLTGTLSSMLRSRGLFDENHVLNIYLDEIKRRIEERELEPEQLHKIMLDSRDIAKFTGR